MDAICREVSNKDMKIIVPKGFYEEALSENVMAGTAMGRRASYMYVAIITPSCREISILGWEQPIPG